VAVALYDYLWVDSTSSAGGGEPFPCCAGIFGKVAGEGGFNWMICSKCFHIVFKLVDGANLGHLVIKVNIFFQLIAFSLIPSGFQGAVFPCKNVKNRSELQF
jgi:hypothetical protein